jgi:glycine cleavage system H protein
MVKIDEHEFPEDLYFHKDHMWAKVEGDKVRVGYNEWAADLAGKLVSIKTRREGRKVKAGKTLGSIESGKWVGSLKIPVSGTIVEVNPELKNKPNIINDAPYEAGWVALIDPDDLEADLSELMKGTDKDKLETWISQEKTKIDA